MVRKEWVRGIIQSLISNTNRLGHYDKEDIETAILVVRGADKRTLHTWFSVLWRLGYLSQPEVGLYDLVLDKVIALEVSFPKELDPRQSHLAAFSNNTHTHSHKVFEGREKE